MKITRKINGIPVDIELTDGELCSAYWEAQEKFDVADIDYWLEDYFDCPEDFAAQFGLGLDEFRENCMGFAGQMLRKYIERNEDACSDATFIAREDAVRTAAEHYLDERKSA